MDLTNQTVVPPLEWRSAEIHLEVAFEGKVRGFRIHGAFARIGSGDRCEIRIPNLGLPVAAYIQVGNGYLAVVELSSTVEMPRCEIQYLLPGGSVWLLPNARVTLEALRMDQGASEAFSWEAYDMEDLRVLPNTLVLEALGAKSEAKDRENQFRLTSAISVLGTHPACQLQLKHRSVAPFQCVIFRGEHVGQPVRVVDLHASVPTQVGGRIAHGDILNVGARLNCGKLVLTARRMLSASPQQYVSSLPGMELLKHRASEGGLLQPEIVLQDGLPAVQPTPWVPAVVIAVGDSNAASPTANPNVASGAASSGSAVAIASQAAPTARPSYPPGAPTGSIAPPSHLPFNLPAHAQPGTGQLPDAANTHQTLLGSATPWEESVERTLAELVHAMRACGERLATLERTLQTHPSFQAPAPEQTVRASTSRDTIAAPQAELQRILAAVAQLESKVTSWQNGSHGQGTEQLPAPTLSTDASRSREHQNPSDERVDWMSRAAGALSHWMRPSSEDDASSPTAPASRTRESPAPRSLDSSPSSPNRQPSHSRARSPKPGNRPQERNNSEAKHTNAAGAKPPRADTPSRHAANEQKRPQNRGPGVAPTQTSRTASGLGASHAPEQSRAAAGSTADDRDLSGVEELIADPMNSRLAASDSVQETLVLGSLVRLRQNKANTSARQLKLAIALFLLFLAITIPIAWSYIPEGWRNMIWVSLNPWDRGDATSP